MPIIRAVVDEQVKINIEEFMRQSELCSIELSLIERIISLVEELNH